MLRIKCYINWAYLIYHVADLLRYNGFEVESIDEKKMTVTGRVSLDKVAGLWEKIKGLEMMEDLK